MITRLKIAMADAAVRRRNVARYRQLAHLDDRILRDIGLTRDDVRAAARNQRSFFYFV